MFCQECLSTGDTEVPWAFEEGNTFDVYGTAIVDVTVVREPKENGQGMLLTPRELPELSVTLGCLRNGEFEGFETVVIPAGKRSHRFYPLWPVLTPNHLVYQCSERIDVQALLIDSTGLGLSDNWVGSPIYPPICAAHYNDLERCLGCL